MGCLAGDEEELSCQGGILCEGKAQGTVGILGWVQPLALLRNNPSVLPVQVEILSLGTLTQTRTMSVPRHRCLLAWECFRHDLPPKKEEKQNKK